MRNVEVKITYFDNIAVSSLLIPEGSKKRVPVGYVNLFYYSKLFRLDLQNIWDNHRDCIKKYMIKAGFGSDFKYVDLRNENNCNSYFVNPYIFAFILVNIYKKKYVNLPEELEHLYFKIQYLQNKL